MVYRQVGAAQVDANRFDGAARFHDGFCALRPLRRYARSRNTIFLLAVKLKSMPASEPQATAASG